MIDGERKRKKARTALEDMSQRVPMTRAGRAEKRRQRSNFRRYEQAANTIYTSLT